MRLLCPGVVVVKLVENGGFVEFLLGRFRVAWIQVAKVYVSSIVTKNRFDVIKFRVLLKVAVPIF